MKKFMILILLGVNFYTCKKDCSGDNPYKEDSYMTITKTSSGIKIHNKYIYPIHVTSLVTLMGPGIVVSEITDNDCKILSGLSHTFKYSDMRFFNNNTSSSINSAQGKFYREYCDYGNRSTNLYNYHADIFTIEF